MSTLRVIVTVLVVNVSCICAFAQEPRTLILKGTVVTPTEVVDDGFVSVTGSRIDQVGTSKQTVMPGTVVETDSFIFPGLIDLHDHITWNMLPRWKPNHQFANRYEWQQDTGYKIALEIPHTKIFEEGLACYANLYGEIKALVNGATSVVGSITPSGPDNGKCMIGNARNLDFYSGFYGKETNQEKLRNEVFPFEISFDVAAQIRSNLESGKLTALLVHLAEGKDASSAREFKIMEKQGFMRAGVSIIHGLALSRPQFKEMSKRKVGLIWSPRSNVELYGSTTNISVAKEEGVSIALAPDWSPSGSDGMLEELRYVATWNAGQNPPIFDDAELVRMATLVPAQLAKVDDKIGSLRPGLYADILLIRKTSVAPYYALIHTDPRDVRLVMVNGVPLYGDLELMNQLLPAEQLERITICSKTKALHIESVGGVHGGVISWKNTTESLRSALNVWGSSLADLAVCEGINQK